MKSARSYTLLFIQASTKYNGPPGADLPGERESAEGNTMQRIHNSDDAIESEIQAKGKTAPRITPADIQAAISAEICFTVGNAARALNCPTSDATDLLTICVLTLHNGFTVTGESACASPENFDYEIGRKIARQNAEQKIWMLEGYLLKQRLSEGY